MSKTNSIVIVVFFVSSAFLACPNLAEAKDGRAALDNLESQCRASLQNTGRAAPTGKKIFPQISSISINLVPLRPLAAGETLDVVVQGDFPDGTTFMFAGWDSHSEMADYDAFDIVKQDPARSTLRATIRLPKTDLRDDRGKPTSSRTYINLDVTALSTSCDDTHMVLDLEKPAVAQQQPAGSKTARGLTYAHSAAKTSPSPTEATTLAAVTAPAATTPVAAPAAIGIAEKQHVIRIGVAVPDAEIGQGNGTGNVAEPIRTMFIQYLNGPGFEIMPITAMLPMQMEAEAKEKGYDYVLYSSVMQKKSGGMSLLKAATLASNLTPIGIMAGATRAATAAAGTAAAAQAASVSSAVKAKTEYTLAYRLVEAGNPTPVLSNSATAKAKSDGEDVITPLIQQAATAIVGQVEAKK